MPNIRNYSTTPANNNSSPPNGWPENMQLSDVNNSARQNMADIRGFAEELPFFDYGHTPTRTGATTFTVATDLTATYVAGRRIKCTDSSTLYGTIASSSYSAPNTTVTVTLDSGSLSASLSAVALGTEVTNKGVSGSSIRGGTPRFDTISENTSAAGVTVDGVLLKDNGITATAGINFGGTTLSTYTEGTFTPTFKGLSTAGSPTYVVQTGIYTRVGRLVTFHVRLQISALGGMTGQLAIGGLPFTCGSVACPISIGEQINLAASTYDLYGWVQGASTDVYLAKAASAGTTSLNSATDITSTLRLWVGGSYYV